MACRLPDGTVRIHAKTAGDPISSIFSYGRRLREMSCDSASRPWGVSASRHRSMGIADWCGIGQPRHSGWVVVRSLRSDAARSRMLGLGRGNTFKYVASSIPCKINTRSLAISGGRLISLQTTLDLVTVVTRLEWTIWDGAERVYGGLDRN